MRLDASLPISGMLLDPGLPKIVPLYSVGEVGFKSSKRFLLQVRSFLPNCTRY
jgi:hypothetical protein